MTPLREGNGENASHTRNVPPFGSPPEKKNKLIIIYYKICSPVWRSAR